MTSDVRSETSFLPAEKATADEIARQSRLFFDSEIMRVADILPLVMVVLNRHRQIVYANTRLAELLGQDDPRALLGKRLGEALGCLHVCAGTAECGTTRFCRFCGAARAILSGLEGGVATQECEISRQTGDIFTALNIQVWMAPLDMAGESFVVGMLMDIHHEKKLKMFERMFYHDILNTAGALSGLCEFLSADPEEGLTESTLSVMKGAVANLMAQIGFQRDFVLAEKNELAVKPVKLGTMLMVQEVMESYRNQRAFDGRPIVLDPKSEDVFFETDRTLLARVLENLVKNALEAVSPGQPVTVGAGRDGNGVFFRVHNPGVMPVSVQSRLFKRSFSTKGESRGLGTYSARLFTENFLRGAISFTSEADAGTTFRVDLPESLSHERKAAATS